MKDEKVSAQRIGENKVPKIKLS